jgi:peroxiredoxin
MNCILIFELLVSLAAIAACCWLGWQLLQQNGRLLLRLEALEERLEDLELAAKDADAEGSKQEAEVEGSLLSPALSSREGEGAGPDRRNRFSDRALANSKINRNGLKAGTVAPEFRLARLDGGELALSELRGRLVLLVFSSPQCGPCNTLAPKLQRFHRKHSELELVMISRESLDENLAKVKEHGLTFPVVLQKQWEVSRAYAYFATPVAYLIDPSGVIAADVAVGVDAIVKLMKRAASTLAQKEKGKVWALVRRVVSWQPS